ncbi:hypothetical protein C8J56DRAFT_1004750 [Mycena floridula]|nr:hypothetical protein C8J56DRAFT_1004750 [Mycena floridula]
MLGEKRRRFEDLLLVPEEKRLASKGWISSFCKTYQIKEYCCHGEAGSRRLAPILALYPKKDQFNTDETGLFAYASPDRTLITHAMSGKNRIDSLPIFFIGKSKQPWAFKKKTPSQKAWMTSKLFEE